MPEKLPDSCTPPQAAINDLLAGPVLDSDGRIVGGTYSGMTPAEVQADKAAFERSGNAWAKKFIAELRAKNEEEKK